MAVAGVRHRCHDQRGFHPARCVASRDQYLRSSALIDTCEALAVFVFAGVWSRRYSVASTDQRVFQSGDAGCAGNCGTPSIVGRARLDRAPLRGGIFRPVAGSGYPRGRPGRGEKAVCRAVFFSNGDHAVAAGFFLAAPGARGVAVLGGVAADGSARQRPSVVATPSTATLLNQGAVCVSGVSRASGESVFVFPAMETTPLLLADELRLVRGERRCCTQHGCVAERSGTVS